FAKEDQVAALADFLEGLPQIVRETRRLPLGVYRGLRFGLVRHREFRPEVYLEGAATRQDTLSREHQGPRAVLNALERLTGGYGAECSRVRQELSVAEAQFRDYQARLGAPFPHDSYLSKLTALRDQLKMGLSGAAPEPGTEPMPAVSELAERIKVLKAVHTIEATAERAGNRRTSAEVPVNARISRRTEPLSEWTGR